MSGGGGSTGNQRQFLYVLESGPCAENGRQAGPTLCRGVPCRQSREPAVMRSTLVSFSLPSRCCKAIDTGRNSPAPDTLTGRIKITGTQWLVV